jgi:hypothetical protein
VRATERTRNTDDANAEPRAGMHARQYAAQVLTDRIEEVANANAEL